jgi:hypothetical protein
VDNCSRNTDHPPSFAHSLSLFCSPPGAKPTSSAQNPGPPPWICGQSAFSRTAALPPFCCAKTGKCSPLPTYPPAPATNQKIYKSIQGRGAGQGLSTPTINVPPCKQASVRLDRRSGGRYFLLRDRGQKIFRSRGLARAFDGSAAAPQSSVAGSGRRDGPFRIEQRD